MENKPYFFLLFTNGSFPNWGGRGPRLGKNSHIFPFFFWQTSLIELCTDPQPELQEEGPKYLVSQAFREKPILCNKRCRTCQTSELTLLIFSCLWTPYLTCYEVHNFARKKSHNSGDVCEFTKCIFSSLLAKTLVKRGEI